MTTNELPALRTAATDAYAKMMRTRGWNDAGSRRDRRAAREAIAAYAKAAGVDMQTATDEIRNV